MPVQLDAYLVVNLDQEQVLARYGHQEDILEDVGIVRVGVVVPAECENIP